MGQQNIDRLNKKLGFTAKDKDMTNCLTLIDKTYYDNMVYCEEYDDVNNSTTWFFDDGSRVELSFEETCLYLMVLEILERDTEEVYIN